MLDFTAVFIPGASETTGYMMEPDRKKGARAKAYFKSSARNLEALNLIA